MRSWAPLGRRVPVRVCVSHRVGAWDAGVLLVTRVRAWRVGWGFDEDLPLRLWPQTQRKQAKRGPDVCAAWLGFFIGYTQITKEIP